MARNNDNAELRRSFTKDVLPPLAKKPLNDVTEHDLRTILRKVIARNAPRRAISLGTLCRIGELLAAEWHHVNLETGEWFIPAKNVKGRRGKKQDHHIFLSPFSLYHFQVLNSLTGTSTWCFPAKDGKGPVFSKTVSKQVGDRQEMFKKT